MSRSSQIVALSLRERTEIDAVFSRVRRGGHYEVLSVSPGADERTIVDESSRLQQWIDGLLEPERLLGEYKPKVEAIAAAVQTAERVLRNPRERLRYDASRPRASDPSQRASESQGRAPSGTKPRPHTPSPRAGATNGAEAQVKYLLAVLDAQLSVVLGRPSGLLLRAAEVDVLHDAERVLSEAEAAERDDRWADAAVWWHLAGLGQPRDPGLLLRAASALRRAGAVTAFGPYARVVTGDPWFDRGEG